MSNTNLKTAKKSKNDEFYTLMEDIEKEMRYYKDFFKGKVVYCNCDDARESNFFKYFSLNFEFLGLKKLISTGYKADGKGVVLVYEGDKNGNRRVDNEEIIVNELNGDGDFRSEECIEYLKECDVVVTNPPFSLFRQYVKQLMDYNKKFIIIGNQNAITYKDIFQLIKNNKIWLGINSNKTMEFNIPMSYNKWSRIEDNRKYAKLGGISWFTNVPYVYDRKPLILTKSYYDNPSAYPKYENFDAINVDKTCDIPMDYDGIMGVPITFLSHYNPSQFEIIALGNSRENFTPNKDYIKPIKVLKDGKKVNGNAINCVLAIESKTKPINMIYYTSENVPYLIAPYARILIKKIQQG